MLYGNPNSLVGITLELRPMGPVPVTIGTGIVGIGRHGHLWAC